MILNGIEDFVHRDDLADRCVSLNLPPIEAASRRAEAEFWRAFSAERPAILGALLSAVVGGLRELPSVQLTELPRMADFACLGEAVGRALGWPEGMFLATYSENRHETTVTALEIRSRDGPARQRRDGRAGELDVVCDRDAERTWRRRARQGEGIVPLAEVASGVHQRAAADCSWASHAGNLGEFYQDPRQPADHDRCRSQLRLFEGAAFLEPGPGARLRLAARRDRQIRPGCTEYRPGLGE